MAVDVAVDAAMVKKADVDDAVIAATCVSVAAVVATVQGMWRAHKVGRGTK